MDKFKKGDSVIEKGTTTPILTIYGKTVKPGFPLYKITDCWTCKWTDSTGDHSREIKEDDLEFIKIDS